jgi:acyl carrier protein
VVKNILAFLPWKLKFKYIKMKLDVFIENFKSQFDEPENLNLSQETNFRELEEWDSIVAISVIAMVDSEYGIKLTGEEIKNSKTVNDLFLILKTKC